MIKTKYVTLLCGLFFLLVTFAFESPNKWLDAMSNTFEVSSEKANSSSAPNTTTPTNFSSNLNVPQSNCGALSLPFTETFNSNSATLNCWTILDNNTDSTSPTSSDIWKTITYSTYEGDGTMYFYGSGKQNDDYLISPTFNLAGGLYELSFYYRTNTYDKNEFELLYSTNGIDSTDFTNVLAPRKIEQIGNYVKATYYLQQITGTVNLAWHVVTNGSTSVYVDNVSLESVDCMAPNINVQTSGVKTDEVTFSWTDTNNQAWEYYLTDVNGSTPVGSGSLTNNKSVTLQKTSGATGNSLQPNTLYDFYLRSTCAATKKSKWIGPYQFRTTCSIQTLPFKEGFDNDSTTINCWSTPTVDSNGTTISNYWKTNTTFFEGTHAMYYYGGTNNDAWAISPTFTLNAAKTYRLKYKYRTTSSYKNDYRVLLSNNGTAISDFTTVLLDVKQHSSNDWADEKIIISNVSGTVNIAWHANTPNSYTYIYIDNIELEEVSCPDPTKLEVSSVLLNQATLSWTENFGNTWEYVVQESGLGLPKGSGLQTKSTTVIATQDNKAKPIQPNTAYEYYVRTVCGANQVSDWTGPLTFRTPCDEQQTPFWEGFNGNSPTLYCWSILDQNKDGNDNSGTWKRHTSNQYEGTTTMRLQVYDFSKNIQTDDWLISPAFKFDKGKTYRLKYHYRGYQSYEQNWIEVAVSNTGKQATDFTKQVVAKKNYNNEKYNEEKVFLKGLTGTVYLGWHATGLGDKEIYIDNVFVEEVIGCPEPLNLAVNNITTNQADLSWTDDMGGSTWEYYVQEVSGVTPTGSGIPVSTKQVTITTDHNGIALKPNTQYEYYVRTVCDKKSTSIWSNPISFYTSCDVYTTPFTEGFDSSSTSLRCWTITDEDNNATSYGTNYWKPSIDSAFEGDQSMMFVGNGAPCNDWFITPALELDNSMYVLKYQYKADTKYENEIRVALSNQGTDSNQFSTELLKTKSIKSPTYTEEVLFFTATKGISHIGWQLVTNGPSTVSIDNISLQKVSGCLEPYHVLITNPTTTTVDLAWQQNGSVSDWEVLVVPFGQPSTATPILKTQVQGTPSITLTNLPEGQAFTVYVRANCGTTYSDWSTAATFGTKIGSNDPCDKALTIPVNKNEICIDKRSTSVNGATSNAAIPKPTCASLMHEDVWYQFTATAPSHMLTLDNVITFTGAQSYEIAASLYDQACATITNNALSCWTFTPSKTFWIMQDLTVGQTYTIRLGANTPQADFYFDLCITTSEYGPIKVEPMGPTNTLDHLVNKILFNTACNLVQNIHYQVGDGSLPTQSINAIGSFEKSNSVFPFEKGIVLTTSEIDYVAGPYRGEINVNRGNNPHRWVGDKDIQDAVNSAGGGPTTDMRVTQLEFDFTPVSDEISFEYLFASNSYSWGCQYKCDAAAMFAAWLVDPITGEGRNLALIQGTDKPIAINTIRDTEKLGIDCESSYPEYFWKHYLNNIDSPIESPVDFAGLTTAMKSPVSKVIPRRTYHIKLAVMDFCSNPEHSSAVFFNAGSFEIGNLDLGADLTIENGTALCTDTTTTLNSGLTAEANLEITWYKDGIEILNANQPTLQVTEAGNYTVKALYTDINCGPEGTIIVEFYPPLSSAILAPVDVNICRFATAEATVDLTEGTQSMLPNTETKHYVLSYYTDVDLKHKVDNPTHYSIGENRIEQLIYVTVQNQTTGCLATYSYKLIPTQGELPATPKDVLVCDRYVLPELETNQVYYTQAGGKGSSYTGGDVIYEGTHQLYIYQDNGQGCFEESSFTIVVTPKVQAMHIEDQHLQCDYFTLPPLEKNNAYFILNNGKRTPVSAGTIIKESETTVLVVFTSENGICMDENEFVITYEPCPIPKGISPNGDGINDAFDLSKHGVTGLKIFNRNGSEVYTFNGIYTNQWSGKNKNGQLLPSGTYYYVMQSFGETRTGWVEVITN